ncbi:hypothetical protein BT96DRAFT_943010 [Gymnopus androsaceus JB14]|uniref:Uncharacterized protein n=1 Tax=Gymnopus androsaceus JB14 TaxID=1447944 RepID=A0A6A4HBM5_9AGAR|nr:hypothetical protein BT96DRAFT_943010 [Gymnopus androsaceus JB14]
MYPFTELAQTEFRYIDDRYGDSVSGRAQGSICTGCAIRLDAKRAYRGSVSTYDANNYPRAVQFNFTGTSLDVFCVIPNLSNNTVTTTYNLTFNLDTRLFCKHSNTRYTFSVLSLSSLASVHHTFTMLMATGENSSNTLQFDYDSELVISPLTSEA